MRYKEIVCDYCHNVATVPTLRKANYCDNCKAIAHNETVKAWKKNNSVLTENTNQVYDATKYMYLKEIQSILNRYGDLRKETIHLWNKARKEADYYTKSGDMLLHKLEIGNMSDADKLSNLKKVEMDRRIRRGMKDSALVLFEIMCSFGLRDSAKFGEMAIEGAKTEKDFHGYLEKMKYNKEIYANALREELKESE